MNPKRQKSPYQNPWPWWAQGLLICWRLIWLVFCRWTPKFLNPWRVLILKLFGGNISGNAFIHSTAKIQIPWNLTMKHRACIGENVNVYNLGKINILERATVAQEVYLCTGTHDFSKPNLQLITRDITIKEDAFIGVRAMIMPGVTVGEKAIIGAMSIVTKDVFIDEVVAGNPARLIDKRNYD